MEKTKSFRELIAWQKAHSLVLAVYHATKSLPKDEQFGLTSQFRRAAVSVAANIAEGYAKRTAAEKIRLLNIAQGSLAECECYLLLTTDLGYMSDPNIANLLSETSKLLTGYIKAIRIQSLPASSS
jgi:four helix bundle protein